MSPAHRSRLARAAVLIAVPLVFAAAAFAQEAPAGLEGTWLLHTPRSRAHAVIDEGIQEAVDSMGPLRRAIGRRRLRAKNRLLGTVVVAREGERIAVTLEDWTGTTRAGRFETVTLDDGEEVQLKQTLTDTRLVQVFRGEDGQRRNVLTLRPDGRAVLAVTVTSDQLPDPLRYRVIYRRR